MTYKNYPEWSIGLALAIAALVQITGYAANPYQVQSGAEAAMKGRGDIGKASAAGSTAQAAAMSNAATSIQAIGKAQDDAQKVIGMSLDNSMKAAKADLDRRKAFLDYQALHAKKNAKKAANKAHQDAAAGAVATIATAHRSSVAWPPIFLRDDFAAPRDRIDQAYADRDPQTGGAGSRFGHEVSQGVSAMKQTLREMTGDLAPAEYNAAKRFLDSLTKEAEQPARAGVAAK